MSTQLDTNSTTTHGQDSLAGHKILRKPVIVTKTRILNLDSGFRHKHLCDGPTFSAGTACGYNCTYCFVGATIGTKPFVTSLLGTSKFQDVVIRREDAPTRLRCELRAANGRLKYKGGEYEAARALGKPIVCYGSPLVDIAASKELAAEATEMVHVLLEDTDWDVRLLSKSPLIKVIAQSLTDEQKHRVIFGVSTGTLDDEVARAIEPTCPSPSQRCEALRWLQDRDFRTFGMLCPILPQPLEQFIHKAIEAIRPEKCEHVWAEVLNVRGESMQQTIASLESKQFISAADELRAICGSGKRNAWEDYARETFLALAKVIPRRETGPRLRFLQYVNKQSEAWWSERINEGAVLLGRMWNQQPGVTQRPRVSESTTINSAHMMPHPQALVDSAVQQVSTLLEKATSLSKAASDVATAAAEVAEKCSNLQAWFLALKKSVDLSSPLGTTTEQHKKTPDPKRSEAAKKAWITIRKKKAVAAAGQMNPP